MNLWTVLSLPVQWKTFHAKWLLTRIQTLQSFYRIFRSRCEEITEWMLSRFFKDGDRGHNAGAGER